MNCTRLFFLGTPGSARKSRRLVALWLVPLVDVKSTSPDTAIHDKNGYAKVYDDKNLIMTNVDNNNSDKTYTDKHKNTEYNVRDTDE